MEEMNLTEEQRQCALSFSCACALMFLASTATMHGKEFGRFPDLDHMVRQTITEYTGLSPEAPEWGDTYLEYCCQQAVILDYGEEGNEEAFTTTVAYMVSVGVSHVMDLCYTPEVAVIPNMERDFGVPKNWVAE
jgi:hypothetical protein